MAGAVISHDGIPVLFSERYKGLLREIAVDPARLFYDSTTGPHHHFYNEDTGEQGAELGVLPW